MDELRSQWEALSAAERDAYAQDYQSAVVEERLLRPVGEDKSKTRHLCSKLSTLHKELGMLLLRRDSIARRFKLVEVGWI